ncbi:DUF2335 domain-containing protein [Schlesneria sp.]|uniref:DUF2335 domain-containing protein n=1 Tax=Schlesneria sp. TaxID=2762018 RepID=UPI002F182706
MERGDSEKGPCDASDSELHLSKESDNSEPDHLSKDDFAEELESVPPEFRPFATKLLSLTFSEFYSGRLPHPRSYRMYEAVLPGAAERIMRIAEDDARDSREINSRIVDSQIEDGIAEREERARGQLYGLIIGITTIVMGGITSCLGQPMAGSVIGTSGVLGLVSVFVATHQKAPKKTDEAAKDE